MHRHPGGRHVLKGRQARLQIAQAFGVGFCDGLTLAIQHVGKALEKSGQIRVCHSHRLLPGASGLRDWIEFKGDEWGEGLLCAVQLRVIDAVDVDVR
ncbi:hypothetical protein D3C73_1445740 [compost metagenome]